MDKFFHLMYDFFSFAFPGACIIMSIILFHTDNELFTKKLQSILTNHAWHAFLALMLMGYIVGYIIKPIARYLLLINTSIFLFGYILPHFKYCVSKIVKDKKSMEKLKYTKKIYKDLRRDLIKKNQSEKFTRIRELAPKNAQYIEFWDMHIAMSHNLAFACIIFMITLLCNYSLSEDFCKGIFLVTFFAFLVLLYISLHFSFWWSNDSVATFKLTKNKYYLKNFR